MVGGTSSEGFLVKSSIIAYWTAAVAEIPVALKLINGSAVTLCFLYKFLEIY